MKPFSATEIARYRDIGAWGDCTLYDILREHAEVRPEQTAVIDPINRANFGDLPAARLTYRNLLARVDSLSGALSGQGVEAGDVVMVQLPNVWELVACYFAVARLGAILSPIAMQYRARELANAQQLTEARILVTTTNFKGMDHATYIEEQLPGRFPAILVLEETAPKGALSLPRLTENWCKRPEVTPPIVDPDSLATICWTSGTEGQPKGVPRTHNNWRASGIAVSDGYGIEGPETLLLPFPLINTAAVGGVLLPWLQCGGTLVLHHPFDVDLFVQQLEEEQVTVAIAAPALLNTLLEKRDLRERLERCSLRSVGTGSAPPSPRLLREYQKNLGIDIINLFGSNEGLLLSSDRDLMPDPEQRARYFPRIGAPDIRWNNRGANWMQGKLVDPETREIIDQPGRIGELAFQGPSLFPGYYRNGELDRSAFDNDGFFFTGDLFEIVEDEQGPRFLKVVGRQKEIIIRGGFNISPAELDRVLEELPGVAEVACAGIPDERLGERVAVYLVPAPGASITLALVRKFLEEKGLTHIKWPERLVILKSLPRNALNKVVRSALSGQTVVVEEGI